MKRYLTLKRLQNAGTLYQPGSVVELSDADARWCIDIGVIEPQPIAEGAPRAYAGGPARAAPCGAGAPRLRRLRVALTWRSIDCCAR
jgi:hypothetical protein